MKKSATDLMQEIVFSAVIDAIDALKARARGVPNNLLRDLNALHANTAFADLPAELQSAIAASVRGAFAKLLKEGYSVSPGQPAPARAARPQGADGPGGERRDRRPSGPRGPDGPGGRGPRRGAPGGDAPRRGPGGGGRGGGGPKRG